MMKREKIKMAERYARSWKSSRKLTERGNFIHHCYDGDLEPLGWWDKVSFLHNNQVVTVLWTHPRFEFEEALETKAPESIVIRPRMKVKQHEYGLDVNLCLPIEVVDQQSLEDLADIVRSILLGEKNLNDFHPAGYAYDYNDWAADQAKMEEDLA